MSKFSGGEDAAYFSRSARSPDRVRLNRQKPGALILGLIPDSRIQDVILVDPSDEETVVLFNLLLMSCPPTSTLSAVCFHRIPFPFQIALPILGRSDGLGLP